MTGRALLSLVVTPRTKADQERLARGVHALKAEDPTMSVTSDPATLDVVIAGMGELHLQIILDRLRREFSVEANASRPRVAYRETVTCVADGEGRLARRSDGRGQFAHANIHLYPGDRGSGYVFENEIVGDAIPRQFITPIDDGIQEALTHGALAGYPLDDLRVVLYDGSYHQLDSSEATFKIAGFMALQDAARKAKPVLLEPIVRSEVVAPKEFLDDVIRNLLLRHGRIRSQEDADSTQRIEVLVPLSRMFGYSTDLRARTHGRGILLGMQFECYEPCDPAEDLGSTDDSMVGAPRRPKPTLRDSSLALPEPSSDDLED